MKVIILAGGKGSRLWPLSEEDCPKQFVTDLPDNNRYSLFQMAYFRALRLADYKDIFVVSNKRYENIIKDQLEFLKIDLIEENLIFEEQGKNTLPAILYGIKMACKEEEDNVAVFSSDHKINDEYALSKIIELTSKVMKDKIVTFGMVPTNPSTEYGYVEPGEKFCNGYEVKHFIEKPDLKHAKKYLKKHYLWNSGMFLLDSKKFKEECKKYTPEIYDAIMNHNTLHDCYSAIEEGTSIDYGILEKTDCAAVVPANVGWSDLGGFDAFYGAFDGDENMNLCKQDLISLNSTNNLVMAQHTTKVVLIDVEDIIAIERNGVLLLCKKDKSYKIKEVVELQEHEKQEIDILQEHRII